LAEHGALVPDEVAVSMHIPDWYEAAYITDIDVLKVGLLLTEAGAAGWWVPGYYGPCGSDARETGFAPGADIAIWLLQDLVEIPRAIRGR